MLPESVESLAAEAVDIVGVREYIAEESDRIFAKIEACEAFSSGSRDADAFFFATGLPIANAVIHYRTPPENLVRAREWARLRWPEEEDPSVALATFTLIYMIGEGWKRYSKIAEKKPLWERIRAHVTALAEEPSPATAA
jgi:hypothetical protein